MSLYASLCPVLSNDLMCSLDWSNFEIADMDFWRSPIYAEYFDYLDSMGGFYYEVSRLRETIVLFSLFPSCLQRWGDAPVHSIAASLFLPKDRIHFFEDIGYTHGSLTHCPQDQRMWSEGRCDCKRWRAYGECSHSFPFLRAQPFCM
jgi:alpha 1,2-mannosyltransferase